MARYLNLKSENFKNTLIYRKAFIVSSKFCYYVI